MKDELLSKLDSNDQAVSEVLVAITDVTLSVDKNQRAIHEVRVEVERRELELLRKGNAIVQEALAKSSAGQRPRPLPEHARVEPSREETSAANASSDRKSEAYLVARRSLRLWPVSREGNLRDRTVEFLVAELLLDQQYAANLDFSVKRVGNPRSNGPVPDSGVRDEVLVEFRSIRDRDDMRSHAKKILRGEEGGLG